MKLREDLDEYKKSNTSEQRMLRNDLYNKSTKEENKQLETRVNLQSDEMFAKMRDIYPEKEVVQKRISKIDR